MLRLLNIKFLLRWLRMMLLAAGLVFAGVLALPLTPVPWDWFRAMAQPGANTQQAPDVIVMMGGGGIPSDSGLMRAYKTAEAARMFPSARIIVAMPLEPEEKLPGLIEQELIMRGVDGTRLQREPRGRNTREQALETRKLLGRDDLTIGLVTSPEHMKRTWDSFQKAGCTRLIAFPSWAEEIKADLSYDESDLGAASLGGYVGGNEILKYKYWDNLLILVKCSRETVALWYYRLMGWI